MKFMTMGASVALAPLPKREAERVVEMAAMFASLKHKPIFFQEIGLRNACSFAAGACRI